MEQHNNDNRNDFFYFNVADESHEKILEKERKKAAEEPLEPLKKVTKVEY